MMKTSFQRFDILLAKLTLGNAVYFRPCIVVYEPAGNRVSVLPITTKHLHRFSDSAFKIDSAHQNFTATGLEETSYILADPMLEPYPADIAMRIGCLEGELARRFEKWFGS